MAEGGKAGEGMSDKWKTQYEAPAGQVWVCGACGKYGKNRSSFGDESCFLNAVLCYESASCEWHAVEDQAGNLDREL